MSEESSTSNGIGGVNVTISGIHDEDETIKSIVHAEIESLLKKILKIININEFVMHVRKYHKEGKRTKYSLHARLMTDLGEFFAEDFEWDLTKATKGVLEKMEKEVIRKSGKKKVHGRGP